MVRHTSMATKVILLPLLYQQVICNDDIDKILVFHPTDKLIWQFEVLKNVRNLKRSLTLTLGSCLILLISFVRRHYVMLLADIIQRHFNYLFLSSVSRMQCLSSPHSKKNNSSKHHMRIRISCQLSTLASFFISFFSVGVTYTYSSP